MNVKHIQFLMRWFELFLFAIQNAESALTFAFTVFRRGRQDVRDPEEGLRRRRISKKNDDFL